MMIRRLFVGLGADMLLVKTARKILIFAVGRGRASVASVASRSEWRASVLDNAAAAKKLSHIRELRMDH
jgi:hypothetical protein